MWSDTIWHRGLLYIGSWGSAEMCMAMLSYVPGLWLGLIILGAALAVDVVAHAIVYARNQM